MAKLHRFMTIDTCPLCGNEVFLRENGFRGKPLNEIPNDTVFEIICADATGTNLSCGEFRISKRDPSTDDNDWMAEYIIHPSPILDSVGE